jgi:tetratricopeptide (TPR) repeat protein
VRYRAFLSYSHADAAWARWLLRRLEGYRVPRRLVGTPGPDGPVPARLGAMFRDRDELPGAGDLSDSIREALAASTALVVVCSPDAARSRWVDAEVEAFRATRRDARVLCFIVAGDPASREPGRDCFPPALLRPGADGSVREPLAADARAEGDGRQRAFLRLVAGLLGVGYDALARREAQRRHRRLAWIAAAALAGMAVTSTLAVTAHVARNDAERRQAQAEDLLGFMLGDLRAKLATVGRLDLMRAVDDKATAYFATLEPRDLGDRALAEQARSLTGIGQVRLEEGDHDAAMAAFREAHARSTALRRRAPGDGQRLYDLAQAEYWLGFVAFRQGDLEEAQARFRRYRDSAVRLAAMDRANFDWQKEVAYAHHNLAVLDESRGRYAEAEGAMREVLALYRQWMAERPGDTMLRFEGANVASWLGTLALQQGRLADAGRLFDEQVAALARNRAQEPADARWREHAADALALRAEVQLKRGRHAAAATDLDEVRSLMAALVRQDPGNHDWQADLAFCRLWQAQLGGPAGRAEARAHLDAALAGFARAHANEPKDRRVLGGLAGARLLAAEWALARGEADAARGEIAAARKLLAPAWREDPGETLRQLLARTWLLEGEALAANGDGDHARAAWTQARALLERDTAAPPFARLEPLVRVLRHLGRDAEARPLQARLDAAGYVPSRAWPARGAIAAVR